MAVVGCAVGGVAPSLPARRVGSGAAAVCQGVHTAPKMLRAVSKPAISPLKAGRALPLGWLRTGCALHAVRVRGHVVRQARVGNAIGLAMPGKQRRE